MTNNTQGTQGVIDAAATVQDDVDRWIEDNVDAFWLAGLYEHPNSAGHRQAREGLLWAVAFEAGSRGLDDRTKGLWYLATLVALRNKGGK